MKKRWLILLFGMLAMFAFYLFSREVKRGFLKQTDFDTTVRIQAHIPARFDSLWETLALPVTPMPSIIFIAVITIIKIVQEKTWKKRFAVFAIPILFVLLVAGEMYGKSVVHHPAPPFFMIKNPTTIFPQFYINEQYSYPSGHTARAVFLGLALWTVTKKKKIAALLIGAYIFLVAVSRIYLGHHWLSDIVGGFLLGGGLGFILI